MSSQRSGLREWDTIGEFGVAVMAEISGEKAETNKSENSPGNPKFLQDWRFPENQAFVGLKFLP